MKSKDKRDPVDVEYVTRFVAYITTKDGRRIYASQFGKRAFPIKVKATDAI